MNDYVYIITVKGIRCAICSTSYRDTLNRLRRLLVNNKSTNVNSYISKVRLKDNKVLCKWKVYSVLDIRKTKITKVYL